MAWRFKHCAPKGVFNLYVGGGGGGGGRELRGGGGH